METRICARCARTLPVKDYRVNRSSRSGYDSCCKECAWVKISRPAADRKLRLAREHSSKDVEQLIEFLEQLERWSDSTHVKRLMVEVAVWRLKMENSDTMTTRMGRPPKRRELPVMLADIWERMAPLVRPEHVHDAKVLVIRAAMLRIDRRAIRTNPQINELIDYTPSEQEIVEACGKIQATWDAMTREQRRSG